MTILLIVVLLFLILGGGWGWRTGYWGYGNPLGIRLQRSAPGVLVREASCR